MAPSKRAKITYKGDDFVSTLKSGKVRVHIERTARGQNILVGIFDIKNKSWHNDTGSVPLPAFIKEQIELLYA